MQSSDCKINARIFFVDGLNQFVNNFIKGDCKVTTTTTVDVEIRSLRKEQPWLRKKQKKLLKKLLKKQLKKLLKRKKSSFFCKAENLEGLT